MANNAPKIATKISCNVKIWVKNDTFFQLTPNNAFPGIVRQRLPAYN